MTDAAFVPTPRPCWIAGEPEQGAAERVVHHPYDGTEVATIAVPGPEQVERAVTAADAAATELRALSAQRRAAALHRLADAIVERGEEIAETITAENGKPLRWAEIEVSRAASTVGFAAEEARRFSGELQRLDTEPDADGRLALVRRRPRGPVLAITPFNDPLRLTAHAAAAALAVGAPVVLKPASATPLSALLLGEMLAETELPSGAFSVLPLSGKEMSPLVGDDRLPVISFAGSTPIGHALRDTAPRKHITLELTGHTAAVVCADWSEDTDLAFAARRIASCGNQQAGQIRLAVDRVIVHAAVADRFVPLLVDAVRELPTGDPHDPAVEVGPMVSAGDAERVRNWVDEALTAGGRLLTGGGGEDNTVPPTVFADIPRTATAWREEVFGPVLTVSTVDSIEEAFEHVDEAAHCRQAAVFTHDMRTAFRASAELAVDGVIVGDVSSSPADRMADGGVPGTGAGREGIRAAMHDLTEAHTVVLSGIPR